MNKLTILKRISWPVNYRNNRNIRKNNVVKFIDLNFY